MHVKFPLIKRLHADAISNYNICYKLGLSRNHGRIANHCIPTHSSVVLSPQASCRSSTAKSHSWHSEEVDAESKALLMFNRSGLEEILNDHHRWLYLYDTLYTKELLAFSRKSKKFGECSFRSHLTSIISRISEFTYFVSLTVLNDDRRIRSVGPIRFNIGPKFWKVVYN